MAMLGLMRVSLRADVDSWDISCYRNRLVSGQTVGACRRVRLGADVGMLVELLLGGVWVIRGAIQYNQSVHMVP